MDRKSIVILSIVVALGIFLRGALLSFIPPSLNWDEVSHGYNAYSILKTGSDEWGQKFPIVNFRAYGDYPTPLNLYLTIPSIALFGLNEIGIRFPHVILGVLTIISAFYLGYGLTKNKSLALLVAFLVAIDPWHVFTSRFVLQSNLSVFLLTTAMAIFINRKNKLHLGVSIFLLFLTLFSYHTTRIVSPLALLGAVAIFWKEIKSKWIYLALCIFLIISALILFDPTARARGKLLFLIDQAAVNRIIEKRNTSSLPPIIKKLAYNRPTYFATEFTKKYLSYFSPQFLFLEGGTQYQFSVPNHGLSYLVSLPFFYIGLLALLFKAKESKDYRLVFLWLLISPIPASLTNETFTVVRATTMLPLPSLITALGVFFVIEKINYPSIKTVLLGALVPLLLLSTENYIYKYAMEYRTTYSWSWQYGYKEVVSYAKDNYTKYDKIIVTKKYGEPHEYFLFFLKYDPWIYQNPNNKISFFQSDWYWVDKFDKFYFVNDWEIPRTTEMFTLESKREIIDCANAKSKCLLITSPDNHPYNWKLLQTINFLDGKKAFEIYEN